MAFSVQPAVPCGSSRGPTVHCATLSMVPTELMASRPRFIHPTPAPVLATTQSFSCSIPGSGGHHLPTLRTAQHHHMDLCVARGQADKQTDAALPRCLFCCLYNQLILAGLPTILCRQRVCTQTAQTTHMHCRCKPHHCGGLAASGAGLQRANRVLSKAAAEHACCQWSPRSCKCNPAGRQR